MSVSWSVVALLLPLIGETVNQGVDSVIVQDVFDVRLKVVVPANAETLRLAGVMLSVGVIPA